MENLTHLPCNRGFNHSTMTPFTTILYETVFRKFNNFLMQLETKVTETEVKIPQLYNVYFKLTYINKTPFHVNPLLLSEYSVEKYINCSMTGFLFSMSKRLSRIELHLPKISFGLLYTTE